MVVWLDINLENMVNAFYKRKIQIVNNFNLINANGVQRDIILISNGTVYLYQTYVDSMTKIVDYALDVIQDTNYQFNNKDSVYWVFLQINKFKI